MNEALAVTSADIGRHFHGNILDMILDSGPMVQFGNLRISEFFRFGEDFRQFIDLHIFVEKHVIFSLGFFNQPIFCQDDGPRDHGKEEEQQKHKLDHGPRIQYHVEDVSMKMSSDIR
ncbi:hypothetical protein ES708_30319 [subsurface metagenome]